MSLLRLELNTYILNEWDDVYREEISYSFSLVDQFILKVESNSKDHGH